MTTLLSKPILLAVLAAVLAIGGAVTKVAMDVHHQRVEQDRARAEAKRQQAVAAHYMKDFRIEDTAKALKAIKDR